MVVFINKNHFLIGGVIAFVLVASMISGCTGTTTNTGTPEPTGTATTPASATAAATTPASSGTKTVTGAPTVSAAGDVVTIAGSESGTADPKLAAGGYIIEVRSKDKADVTVETKDSTMHISPQYYPTASDGLHLFLQPIEFKGGELTISANGPYVIKMTKLPLAAAADPAPKTYTGKGDTVVGPISLNQGTVNLKGTTGKITVVLYDATSGEAVGIHRDLYKVSPGKIGPGEKTEDVPATGTYLFNLEVPDNSDWEFSVSQ